MRTETITDLPSCAPENPLEALEWLGSTVEEVAEGLRARGIKGHQRGAASSSCPLAVYLQQWWSDGWFAYTWCHADEKTLEAPLACTQFAYRYDDHKFPDLEA